MKKPKLMDFVSTVPVEFPDGKKDIAQIDFPKYAFALEDYVQFLENCLKGAYYTLGKQKGK